MEIKMKLGQLSRSFAEKNIKDLLDLSESTSEELEQEPWSKDNFMMELPLKWQISRYFSLSIKGPFNEDSYDINNKGIKASTHHLRQIDTTDKSLIGCLIGYSRFTGYGPDRGDGAPYGFIPTIMVKTGYRGREFRVSDMSIAELMMHEYHQMCRKYGIMNSRLGVLEDNENALGLYLRLGYNAIGTHIGVDSMKRIVMEHKLERRKKRYGADDRGEQ